MRTFLYQTDLSMAFGHKTTGTSTDGLINSNDADTLDAVSDSDSPTAKTPISIDLLGNGAPAGAIPALPDSPVHSIDPSVHTIPYNPMSLSFQQNLQPYQTTTDASQSKGTTLQASSIIPNALVDVVEDITPLPPQISAVENTPYNSGPLFTHTDLDDTLTYVPLVPLPSWLTLNANGTISGIPNDTQIGTYDIIIGAANFDPDNANDPGNFVATEFLLMVTDAHNEIALKAAPALLTVRDYTFTSNLFNASTLFSSDDKLTYTADPGHPLPTGLIVNSTTGIISGTPNVVVAGSYRVDIIAHNMDPNNPGEQMKSNLFTISIAPFYYSDITAGAFNDSLAIDGFTHVWAWGNNSKGQLGNNTITNSSIPIGVHGAGNIGVFSNVIEISEGNATSLALSSAGFVYAWGSNLTGQLGNNTTTDSHFPIQVLGVGGLGHLAGIIAISEGGTLVASQDTSLALSSSGNVYAWGYNNHGQVGNNTSSGVTFQKTPVEVHGIGNIGVLSHIIEISEGNATSLALSSAGNVYAWGNNGKGELGNNTATDSHTPVEVHGVGNAGFLSTIIAIAEDGGSAGTTNGTSLALSSAGHVYAWGYNNHGQLGNNTITGSHAPVEVHGPGNVGFLSHIIQISVDNGTSLALQSNGVVWAWGNNSNGQLGNNTITDSHTPVEVHGPANIGFLSHVIAIFEGNGSSIALLDTGTVGTWGNNINGQLGIGNTTQHTTPVEITGNMVSSGINLVNVVTEPGSTGLPAAGGIGLQGANVIAIHDVLSFTTPANDFLVLRLDNPTVHTLTKSFFGTVTPAELDTVASFSYNSILNQTDIHFHGGGDILLSGVHYTAFENFMPGHLIVSHLASL